MYHKHERLPISVGQQNQFVCITYICKSYSIKRKINHLPKGCKFSISFSIIHKSNSYKISEIFLSLTYSIKWKINHLPKGCQLAGASGAQQQQRTQEEVRGCHRQHHAGETYQGGQTNREDSPCNNNNDVY